MSAIADAPSIAIPAPRRARPASALLTLARRRASLTSKTPRQIAVPLLGPALLALVVAPALKVATGGLHSHIDYTSFVGVGAVGLVIPLSCIFAGLSVLVDRHSGAQRELLAAPVPRAYLVLGNLVVAIGLATLFATIPVLAAGLILTADRSTAGGKKTDKDKLQGTWTAVSAVKEGKPAPDDFVKEFKLTFKGDKLTASVAGGDKEATFKLDTTKKPGQITITPSDGEKAVAGIYSFDGDTLKLCIAEGEAAIPTEFAAKAGSRAMLLVLKRAK